MLWNDIVPVWYYCLPVCPTVIKVILISFVAGCQTYLLYALRQRKRRVYRFTAVLGIGFFLLGIARIWYMQQQSYTIETILKEQETSLSVETDASRGWQTENEKTILQGKIEKKERKNNQTRLYLNHVFLRIGDKTYKTNSVLVRLKQEPSDQSCRIGTTIVLEGNIRQLNRAANDGNYDEFQYYHSLNMDYHFDAERICGEYGREDVLAEKLFSIKEKLKELMPLEETLKQARQIENIHKIIKNNGGDFNLTPEQLELSKILV